MSQRYKAILMFGAPGVGKGTQGAMLGKIPGFHHVSSGDIFRSLDPNSELGKVFFSHSSKGELVPDDVTIEVWRTNVNAQTLLGQFQPKKQLLISDGIPRSAAQAEIMSQYIDVLKIIHLVVADEDEMVARMKRRAIKQGRADDAREDVLRNRFEVYRRETYPVLKHYGRELIVDVNGYGSPAAILHQILGHIVPVLDEHFANPLC